MFDGDNIGALCPLFQGDQGYPVKIARRSNDFAVLTVLDLCLCLFEKHARKLPQSCVFLYHSLADNITEQCAVTVM